MVNTKWADFCISEVRYDKERKHIVAVRARVDNGDSIGAPIEQLRATVVANIEKNVSYVTITKKNDGNWTKGQRVFVVTINRVKYIKTVENNKESDNLENLPEY